jgi:hypothetical protein|eukprot:SAG25_NODE_1418_length_3078_cov_5.140651_4_plen_419_part_00
MSWPIRSAVAPCKHIARAALVLLLTLWLAPAGVQAAEAPSTAAAGGWFSSLLFGTVDPPSLDGDAPKATQEVPGEEHMGDTVAGWLRARGDGSNECAVETRRAVLDGPSISTPQAEEHAKRSFILAEAKRLGIDPSRIVIDSVEEVDDAAVAARADDMDRLEKQHQYQLAAMHAAAESGHAEVVDQLLRAGVDPDQLDDDGLTPLRKAAAHVNGRTPSGHDEIVRRLLEAGADANRADEESGETLLYKAAQDGNEMMLERLLMVQADTSQIESRRGETALHVAARMGRESVVRRLVEAGADPESLDDQGLSPLQWAADKGHAAVVSLLRTQVADRVAKVPQSLEAGSATKQVHAESVQTDLLPLLESLRLSHHHKSFVEAGITHVEDLKLVECEADLDELGVTKKFERRKLQRFLEQM